MAGQRNSSYYQCPDMMDSLQNGLTKPWSSGRILTGTQREQKQNKDRANKRERRKKEREDKEQLERKLAILQQQSQFGHKGIIPDCKLRCPTNLYTLLIIHWQDHVQEI